MKTELFNGKKITIRTIKKSDVKKAKAFWEFINSLIKEDAMILQNKKATPKAEIEFLENILKTKNKKTGVFLVAECDGNIVGSPNIPLEKWRRSHIGKFGIAIRNGYRGIGLGKCLMAEIIKLAKKELKPRLKIVQLEVYANNEPAMQLYKKMGFTIVARRPKQVQYKGKLIDD